MAVEQVGGYVGGAGQPGSRAFTFGFNAGKIDGAAEALGFDLKKVVPQTWQKPLNLGSARAAGSKAEWKRKLKGCAQQHFPGLVVTLKTADALLILKWATEQ